MSEDVLANQYQQQLNAKQQVLSDMLAPFAAPGLEVFSSPAQGYRLRAEFRIWHEQDDLFYAMFEPGDKRSPIRIDQSPMVSVTIAKVMQSLLDEIRQQEVLRRKLFQIDFLSTLSGELLVTLLYHKPLNDDWQQAARALKGQFGFELIGRSRKTKIVMDHDFVTEELAVGEDRLRYQQIENSFTQPNGQVAIKMIEWARDVTQHSDADLLELYCGNANFSIALSKNFNQVFATEIAKSSVNSALVNIEQNQIENVTVVRLSSEEFTQAMNGEREFRRLKEKAIDLPSYDFKTVLVDPPRAGLDAATTTMIQQFERILYISCNPATLCENLQQLIQTHRIERAALFDQFPFTEHMEAGVWLVKK